MPKLLGADYSKPKHPRPYPYTKHPNTSVSKHVEGGIVKLYDGVPVELREKESPRLGLDNSSTANRVDELKDYLDVEVQSAAGDALRKDAALKMRDDIRSGCLSWFTQGHTWGLVNPEAVEKGQKAIGKIYPEFNGAP
jgi:hypothetical protein